MTPQLQALVPRWYRPPWRDRRQKALATAARLSGFLPAEIKGSARDAGMCRARWAVMRALRQQGLSLFQIGRFIGGRDHTTVMNGLTRCAEFMAADPAYRDFCDAVAAS